MKPYFGFKIKNKLPRGKTGEVLPKRKSLFLSLSSRQVARYYKARNEERSEGKTGRKITRLTFFAILFFLSISLVRSYWKVINARKTVEKVQDRVLELANEQKDLESKLEIAESEDYIEKQLRDSLGMSREGEIVVILPEDEILRKLAPDFPKEEEALPDPNWRKWMKLFLW